MKSIIIFLIFTFYNISFSQIDYEIKSNSKSEFEVKFLSKKDAKVFKVFSNNELDTIYYNEYELSPIDEENSFYFNINSIKDTLNNLNIIFYQSTKIFLFNIQSDTLNKFIIKDITKNLDKKSIKKLTQASSKIIEPIFKRERLEKEANTVYQCQGITKKGYQCSRTIQGKKYCWQHE